MFFQKGWCLDNNGYPNSGPEVERLIAVRPSPGQLAFGDMEYYSFIHFGMNTFTNSEWGTGKESPALFSPETIDTDQWCEVLKASGSRAVILTAKHHDGFCLWPSAHTEHSVKNSPYLGGKGDVVRQMMESCKKYGMKFGIYLSPWDRNAATYGTDAYNDFYVNQLTELCTNYGEVFEYWFDGACGEGPNGKRQAYDFDRYFAVIKELRPQALTAIVGRDVRWIGNEAGKARESEWSVVSSGNAKYEAVAERSQKADGDTAVLERVSEEEADLGSREKVLRYRNLVWYPAEADTSITPGWFYHENSYYGQKNQMLKTAGQLADIYFNTVGGNATLLLNVPPSPRGVIEERDVKLLQEFKAHIDKVFALPVTTFSLSVLSQNEKRTPAGLESLKTGGSYCFAKDEYILSCRFEREEQIAAIVIQEDIRHSQRVEAFSVFAGRDGQHENLADCTVIGSKRIIRLKEHVRADEICFVFTQSRGNPVIKSVAFFS
ncbi:MAG: alpha-L-fucosidase [Oscillospiraceae bacterium]|jgi:alpha-L-fucosidase|nr:alpha-L-fucosidase [Oscillospiraceae bacterium]